MNENGKMRPRCSISAKLIWPLLVDQYTEAEKVGYRVIIAVTMLHELTVSHLDRRKVMSREVQY